MKEKDILQDFKRINKVYGSFEMKLCKSNCIPFKAVKDWQIEGLLKISSANGLYHKISDQPIFAGMKTSITYHKPFDCFNLCNIPAYVVICFWKPRELKEFHYIHIKDFIAEKSESKRKSLTYQRSKEISSLVLGA